jgi:hypothetical protein
MGEQEQKIVNMAEVELAIRKILDSKLDPVAKDIDCIKTKLNNHLEHFAYEFTEVRQDVNWIKKFFNPEKVAVNDVQSKTEINWLKWGVRLIIGGVILEAIAIIFHVFEII